MKQEGKKDWGPRPLDNPDFVEQMYAGFAQGAKDIEDKRREQARQVNVVSALHATDALGVTPINKVSYVKGVEHTSPIPPEIPFHPARDISDRDWTGMISYLARCDNYPEGTSSRDSRWYSAILHHANMKIISEKDAGKLKYEDRVWQGVEDSLESDRLEGQWWPFRTVAVPARISSPERYAKTSFANQDTWRWLNDSREVIRKRGDDLDYYGHCAALMVLFPDRLPEMSAYMNDEEGYNKFFLKTTMRREAACSSPDWDNYSELAASGKIIFPKLIRPGSKAWRGMHALMDEYRREKKYVKVAELGARMTIIAADDIRVTNHGLDIIRVNASGK